MILTVTINPLLERRLTIDELVPGSEHRSSGEIFTAGGKGINVSRQLNALGLNNLAFTFAGGNSGKIFKNLVASEKINMTFVPTKSETRQASLIIESAKERITTVFGVNQDLIQSEIDEFKTKLSKMIENCEIVIFSGSSPNELADDIFTFGISRANEFDKISICDTYGRHLKACIEAGPTVLHNNISETEASMNVSLNEEKEIVDYLNYLYSKNIKQSFLTNGGGYVFASNFDFIYKAEVPEIKQADSTGSGDAFTAGLAFGLHNAQTFQETIQTAIALGAANSSKWDVCNVTPEEYAKYLDSVKIHTVGKKINTIH